MQIRFVVLLLATASLAACSAVQSLEHPSGQKDQQAVQELDFSDYASTSNVQVYSLDKPIAQDAGPSGYLPTDIYEGEVSRKDSNVMVYSLDGRKTPVAGVPLLMSPRTDADGFLSPFPVMQSPVVARQGAGVEVARSQPIVPAPQAGSRIFFAHDSDALDASDRSLLLKLAKAYSENPGIINIVGHASPRASAPSPEVKDVVNLRVSLDRAFEVSKFLILNGVPADAIRTIGRGDADPGLIVPGMREEEASRRVEIYLSGN